ncbi:MAG: triphosphoribosyl-dephospho-CoA synthase [Pirellulaceae bacterium]|nr:triphosphoribosyl-dephospho-CoA synthase [Pirellulaceae bacterium]
MNGHPSKRWLCQTWPTGDAAALACSLEASAPKAGNVSPAVAFADMDFSDFLVSGLSIRAIFEQAETLSVGELVLQAVTATRRRLDVNTNLGSILLLAPLAKAMPLYASTRFTKPPLVSTYALTAATTPSGTVSSGTVSSGSGKNLTQGKPLSPGKVFDAAALRMAVHTVLGQLTAEDARLVYEAIRLAKPGGLGQAQQHDVHASPPGDLLTAMAAAADVDAVARQYVNDFQEVAELMIAWLQLALTRGLSVPHAIVELQLRFMAAQPDGLIVRKSGNDVALRAQELAHAALEEWLATAQSGEAWQTLDNYLRGDGHQRNPGTTADLIAATLFVQLAI